jgi:hypothetical protein
VQLEGTKSQTQQQHEHLLKDKLNIDEVTYQESIPLVPLDIEPKGMQCVKFTHGRNVELCIVY